MAYILNSNVADKKKSAKALTKIPGLGNNLTKQICDKLGFSAHIKFKKLSTDKISKFISQNYLITTSLRRKIEKDKSRNIAISCYKGFRYVNGLPCRGQRTHGNAQTARKNSPYNRNVAVNKKVGKKNKKKK